MLYASCLTLAACGTADDSSVNVSLIGPTPVSVDSDRVPMGRTSAELARATAQGLVAFDQNGQIEPALAESWTFTKDGLSVIFRIRRLRWSGGAEVTGRDVAESLNRSMASASKNRLKPLLSAVEGVVGMTDRVVEIRLKVPRPNLLQLLAQPELGIRKRGAGTGPWIAIVGSTPIVLIPRQSAEEMAGEITISRPIAQIVLRGERAALAITRFRAQRGGFVTGGTLADWPLVQAAQLRNTLVRVDPAEGLFGLAANARSSFMKDEILRDALSMAIDRDTLVGTFNVPKWLPLDRLLPARLDSARPPALPDWSGQEIGERRSNARQIIARWVAARGPVAPLRVALPAGPGMTMLFARIAADWRAIGIRAERVPLSTANADFRLIDEVAPNTSANWYLTRTSCDAGLPCDRDSDFALKASRAAPTLAHRAYEIAKADTEAAPYAAYIPLARPVRWSLVAPSLNGFRENAFAVHPFAALRQPRN